MPEEDRVQRAQRLRDGLLEMAYQLHHEKPGHMLNVNRTAMEMGLESEEFEAPFQYLLDLGYIKAVAMDPEGGIPLIQITTPGILAVEARGSSQSSSVSHAIGSVNQLFLGSVGVVQSGQRNEATVDMRSGASVQDIVGVIESLKGFRGRLPEEIQEEYLAEVEELEAVATAPVKKPNVFRRVRDAGMAIAALLATGSVATKDTTEILQNVDEVRKWVDGVFK